MAEERTARVDISAVDEGGRNVYGTVVINVFGPCTIDEIATWAMDYVDNGGLAWGPHGYKGAIAQAAVIDSVADGLSGNPSTELHCE